MMNKDYPAYAREVAIGIDVSLDPEFHRKTAAGPNQYLKASRLYPDLIQLVLQSGDLFTKYYCGEYKFWKKKSYELFMRLAMLGLYPELEKTLDQYKSAEVQAEPLGLSAITDMSFDASSEQREDSSSELPEGLKELESATFKLRHMGKDTFSHVDSLRELLLRCYYLRVTGTGKLSWLNDTLRKCAAVPELFAEGAEEKQRLIRLKTFFQAFTAFHRHTATSLLHYLVKYEELESDIEKLLQGAAKKYINCLNSKGRSPLYEAARVGNLRAVRQLLEAGATVSAQGESALYAALQGPLHSCGRPLPQDEETRRLQILEELLAKAPTVQFEGEDSSGYDDSFPLEKALMKGPPTSFGFPLILACARYSEAGVRKLLALGLSPCSVHEQNVTQKRRGADKRIAVSTVQVKTCPLKEALKRRNIDIAQTIADELAAKYPKVVEKQEELYRECGVLAKRLRLNTPLFK